MGAGARRVWAGALAALGVALSAHAAGAEPKRLALVLGNAAYDAGFFEPLPNALNDMSDMSAALKRIGFEVTSSQDLKNADLGRVLDAFSAKLAAGDQVVVFFAGHGVMGGVKAGSETVENYLTPVESTQRTIGRTPPEALALGRVLAALERAGAGPRVVIMDACRQSTADISQGAAAGPVKGEGLVQPPTVSLKKVFLAFATSPGSFAEDAGDGGAARNGRFTSEVLRRLEQPGMTVNRLFEEVSTAVDYGSQGKQVPWFIDGDGSVGDLVLRTSAGAPKAAAAAPDPLVADLRLVREAVACGLPVCLESAAADVRDAVLQAELLTRAAGLRAAAKAAVEPGAAVPLGPPPALETPALSPENRAWVAARRRTPGEWTEVADRLVSGRGGFPKDEVSAVRWYKAAAGAGHGAAAYALGSAYRRGIAGVPRNPEEAIRWFRRSADLGYAPAFAMASRLEIYGRYEFTRDRDDFKVADKAAYAAAERWAEQGTAKGDPASMRELAGFHRSRELVDREAKTKKVALLRRAAEGGDTSAMLEADDFAAGPEVLAWWRKAAALGDLDAYDRLAAAFEKGTAFAPQDELEALQWRLQGAERGHGASMFALATAYEGGGGAYRAGGALRRDCRQAGVWYRRAAMTGEAKAFDRLYAGRDRYTAGGCTSLR